MASGGSLPSLNQIRSIIATIRIKQIWGVKGIKQFICLFSFLFTVFFQEREGTREGRRYPHPSRVRERGQEAEISSHHGGLVSTLTSTSRSCPQMHHLHPDSILSLYSIQRFK